MSRVLRAKDRCKPCTARFCYYFIIVVVLENIIIAWNASSKFGSDDATVVTDVDYGASRQSISGLDAVASSNTSPPTRPSSAPSTPNTVTPTTEHSQQPPEDVLQRALRPLTPLEERERNFYKRRSTPVNAFPYNFRRMPPGLCHDETRLVVLIHSHPKYFDRRDAIRKSWGSAVKTGRWPHHDPDAVGRNHTNMVVGESGVNGRPSTVNGRPSRFLRTCCGRMEMAFVVALSRDPGINDAVDEEFLAHWDIIQGDFIDDYNNMTLKSLLGLKFVVERCPKVEYLVKSDDDMVINLPHLVDTIDAVAANFTRFVIGPLTVGSRVYRNGKWKLTHEEFPFETFPPYESGSAYVISSDVIGELFETSQYVPAIFIDDVYITGILGRIVGVRHVWMPGFAYWVSGAPSACDLVARRIVTGTKMDPSGLRLIWEDLNRKPVCEV